MVQALFLLTCLLAGQTAAPVSSGDTELAERYLTALYGQNLELLEELADEDILFQDSTATHFPNGPWRYQGREAVVGFFRSSLEGVDSTGFEIIRKFTSGEQTVLEVVYWTKGDGKLLGAPGVTLELRVPGVTVITVREGKVVEHQDFIDYPSLMHQVEEQAQKRRRLEDRSNARRFGQPVGSR